MKKRSPDDLFNKRFYRGEVRLITNQKEKAHKCDDNEHCRYRQQRAAKNQVQGKDKQQEERNPTHPSGSRYLLLPFPHGASIGFWSLER